MSGEEIAVSQISQWYSGKCVFITGGTGFLGKALMEKLLRSCSDIKTIYILLRSKRGILPDDRLATLLNDPLYDIIRKENPENLKKIIIIKGDMQEPNLGICPEDRAELIRNVSVVYHCAATIKFNEPLQTAVGMNVMGTKEAIHLALEMKNLQAFIHLSTAYSNCNRNEIEEKLYEPPIEFDKLIQLIKLIDEDTLKYLTPKLLKDWPNTYTFTKALAEQLVSAYVHLVGLPAVILRPAIVTATWQEPMPGWIDNINGATGLLLAGAKGIIRSVPTHPKIIPCLIPLDIVVNLMVTAAWNIGINKCTSVSVFNCSTGIINPVCQSRMYEILHKWVEEYPLENEVWYPRLVMIPNKTFYRIYSILFRTVPAYAFDYAMMILGKKTFAVKLSSKIDMFVETYGHFVCKNQWKFHSENIPKLLETLSVADKKTFNFNVRPMCWDEYFKNYHLGVKRFILKESMDNLPAAKTRHQRLKIIYYSLNWLLFLGFFVICFKYIFQM